MIASNAVLELSPTWTSFHVTIVGVFVVSGNYCNGLFNQLSTDGRFCHCQSFIMIYYNKCP